MNKIIILVAYINCQHPMRIIQQHRFFIIPLLFFMVLLLLPLLFISRQEQHLLINAFHHPVADVFFKIITYAGSGLFVFFIGIILLFYFVRYGIAVIGGYLISGLVVQLLKRLVFFDSGRPSQVIGTTHLHVVDGVQLLCCHSFPSGHAASAFALCTVLAMLTEKKLLKFIWFFTAAVIAFSRVYLSQHFCADIATGAFIGFISTAALVLYLEQRPACWLDQPIHRIKY